MTRRYFADPLPPTGGKLLLDDAESQHAIRVMRLQVGDEVELFDGRGQEAAARVSEISRKQCWCDAGPAVPINRESATRLHLGVALPKPDRAKEMVERLTELGVASLTPLHAQRSQRAPSASVLGKLERIVIEASKQCGRNQLMRIGEPVTVEAFLATASAGQDSRWILHTSPRLPRLDSGLAAEEVLGLIGPEGGWTDEELALAVAAGCQTLSLGARVLRVETAAVALAARCCRD